MSIAQPTVISRSFRVTSPQCESQRKRVARLKKAKNIAKRAAIDADLVKARPHPVLGLSESNMEKWKETKLYKILVKPEDLEAATATSGTGPGQQHASSVAPTNLAFGLAQDTVHHLLHTLPALNKSLQLTNQQGRGDQLGSILNRRNGPDAKRPYTPYDYTMPLTSSPANPTNASEPHVDKASEAIMKIIDLRNASAGGIAYVNRRRIVEAFSSPVKGRKGPDTGRPEVQGE